MKKILIGIVATIGLGAIGLALADHFGLLDN